MFEQFSGYFGVSEVMSLRTARQRAVFQKQFWKLFRRLHTPHP